MGWKRLGADKPAATSSVALYTAPSAALVSSLFICNQDNDTADTVRVAVTDGGAITVDDYLLYEVTIPPYSTREIVSGIALASGAKIYVRSQQGVTSFAAFGNEGV